VELEFLLFPIIGYLVGSLHFALWITRKVRGINVRNGVSGHVTTINIIRQVDGYLFSLLQYWM
jgi:glycerol-3-phosphate acyltransferase PlsY